MMYHNTRVNNSTSFVEEMPLVRSQFMQEALNQRQYENRQAIIRHTSTHQSEKGIQTRSAGNHQRISRQQQTGKNRRSRNSSLSDRKQTHARTSSLTSERRRRLQSSFESSTDSDCDAVSVSMSKMVPKNASLMASLPTITLQRAFDPEELLGDSCHVSKHKLLPEQEILFLPKEQPIISGNTGAKGLEYSKGRLFPRGGKESSSSKDMHNFHLVSTKKVKEFNRRTSVDIVPRKRYSHPLYDRKRPTVLNNEGNVCYSKENDVMTQKNPWFGEDEFSRNKISSHNSNYMGFSKQDYSTSCPSFKPIESNHSYHRRKLNRT